MEKTSCENTYSHRMFSPEYGTLHCQTAHTRIMPENTTSLRKTKWGSALGNPSARSHWWPNVCCL